MDTQDARVEFARNHHEAAARVDLNATAHRQQRDRWVRQLRAEDPTRWSYPQLASAVGCSQRLIRQILKKGIEA